MYRQACGIIVLSLCVYALFFDQLGDRDLWASHEARAGQNAQVMLDRLPTAPPGYEVARVDVVVRLKKTG